MTPAGVYTVLHSFSGNPDGNAPKAGLIQASDGNFYGTTYFGGGLTYGCVFRMTPDGTVTVIHAFGSTPTDGQNPRASLIQARDGNLWGTTQKGGNSDRGTVFAMNLQGTTLFQYSFTGVADGAYPYAPLIEAKNGALYGTVYAGDFSTHGRAFVAWGGTVTVLHTFLSGADGANPIGGLIEGADGNFYGTTHFGGTFNQGTVFKMAPNGDVTIIKSFSGGAEGAWPDTSLIQPRDGNVYGSTRIGGVGYGTLFKVSPTGIVTTLHTFTGGADGANPGAALIEAAGGALFGYDRQRWRLRRRHLSVGHDSGRRRPRRLRRRWICRSFLFRPSTSNVFIAGSTTSMTWTWGVAGDIPVQGDYDGDGITDVALFRPSTGGWSIIKSTTWTAVTITYGVNGDVPVPADYDGDGRTDVAVFRPSTGTWYLGTGVTLVFGGAGDIPVPGDYNGDGKTDIAIFRPSTGAWFLSTGGSFTFGGAGDVPVAGDYDGDGKTDVAIFRPSNSRWFIGTGASYTWGGGGDVPVPGDYDADGKIDVAIFRPATGQWFVINSNTFTASVVTFGGYGDIPFLKRP